MKKIRLFYLKIFQFLEVKFSIYLNRRVFVMASAHVSLLGGAMRNRVFGHIKTFLDYWYNWIL